MGDDIRITGNYSNVILNIKSTLTNVQQSVGTMPAVDDTARQELQRLIEQLSKELEQIPASLKEEAQAVAASVQVLVDTAKTQQPNKPMLQITADGLKKAAANLASVAPMIATIAGQVVTAIFQMKGLA
jgi:methyl-accepting chemotaxis protein